MERISLHELVAVNNTPKAKALVIKYGYEPARSYDDLVYKLYRITKEYREEGLKDIANLHPHKDLVLNYFGEKDCKCNEPLRVRKRLNKRYSNFEFSDEFIDAEGSNQLLKKSTDTFKEYIPLIAVAGLFALAITSISK